MRTYDEILADIKKLAKVSSNKELCEFLNIPYKNLNMWQYRGVIPAKKLIEISEKLNVSIDLLINGDTNDINLQLQPSTDNPKLQSEIFKEFLELFKDYGNDKILLPIIEKLREIERISKE
ncbi:helix-turn-helix domain-containing protein [Campylobacter sp. RM16188]|uniref:helix-turn-helix domain-containing protein n=1 Tax=Campylobacter sp. RM16188 TaxID=1705725 RepID=UPI001556F8E0|nr:helix-turn-helix domain-containing protein [Campylobacter sp. RM16188]